MEPTITKIDGNTIQVVKNVTTTQTNTYSLGDLVKQREMIEIQKANEITLRDKELAEVNSLITECEKLGLNLKPPIEIIK